MTLIQIYGRGFISVAFIFILNTYLWVTRLNQSSLNSEVLVTSLFGSFILMSYTLFRFEINMRAASTLGLVGAGGIGAPLLFSIRSRAWDRTFTIVAVLIVTVTIIDYISGKVRKNLVK